MMNTSVHVVSKVSSEESKRYAECVSTGMSAGKMPAMFSSKLLWGVLFSCAILAALLYWAAQTSPEAKERFRTGTAAAGNITQTVSANGTLNPVVLVSVGTQVSGTVKRLHVDFNDHVKKDQVLLELDPALLQAQLSQSEANVSNAEASLALAITNEARQRTLLSQDSIARQDYDQAQHALRSARAQLSQARAQRNKDKTNLGYATIRSPVSGVIVDRQVDVGQTVAASFQTPTLFRIAQDLRNMQIDSSFAEADIGKIKIGQPVRFNVDAFPNRNFSGTVRQVRLNPTVQQNVVTYDVVVAVDNPDQILMPGMTAYVNITVDQRSNVLLVPSAALRYRPSPGTPVLPTRAGTARGARVAKGDTTRALVYVLDGRQLRPVEIETGISDGRNVEVIAGEIRADERVVVEDMNAPAPQAPGTLRMRMF